MPNKINDNITGTSDNGIFWDRPSNPGIYWYGLHVFDQAGNMGIEPTPIKVNVVSPTGIVIDNNDYGVTKSDNWTQNDAYPGYYDTNYFYSHSTDNEWFQWTTSLTPGKYDVYAWWQAANGRPTNAIYETQHANGTSNTTVNQEENGAQWNLLGNYSFNNTATVKLYNNSNSDNGASADAIRFVKVNNTVINLMDSTTDILPNFGASYNVFDTEKKLVVKGEEQDSKINIVAGNNLSNQYIWETGYISRNNVWQSFTYTKDSSHEALYSKWITGQARAIPDITPTEMNNGVYVLAYICNYINNDWKCGCKDQACTERYWSLQKISY